MIETITLRNYRGHTATEVPCRRFTALVGENACGKTSVLDAVRWISEGIGETLPASMLRRSARALSVSLAGARDGAPWRIDAEFEPADRGDELRATRREVVDAATGQMGRRPLAVALTLNAEQLAASSTATTVRPGLASSGAGLASVLAYLKLSETERFERIVERVRGVVPLVRGIRFERVQEIVEVSRALRVEDQQIQVSEKVPVIRDALLFDFADADRVPASMVSEGTLLTLGVFTALETVERRTYVGAEGIVSPVEVVLIDDIDRALHPRAQRALLATLRAVLDQSPALQIIATSHSPYLVDALAPEEVVVLGRNAQSVIVAKGLDTFPDERLRAMLSTGELWMAEGEDWVRR